MIATRSMIVLSVLVVALSGCRTARRAESLRDGVLIVGISQGEFKNQWGSPDRTESQLSEEVIRSRWSVFGGHLQQGNVPRDLWIYDRLGVELLFEGGNLIAWKTDKTVEQLRSISERR